MAVENLGTTQIRKPDYQDQRWDVPLNENWESIAAMLETLVSGYRWVSGLEYSGDGGLNFTVAAGVINKDSVDVPITGGSSSVQDGSTQYVYLSDAGGLVVANTFEDTGIFPLYMIQASGGVIVSVGDLRNYQVASPGGGGGGGLDWATGVQTSDFVAEVGKGYNIDTSSGSITMTLPVLDIGGQIAYKDYDNTFDIFSLFVDPGAGIIEGYPAGEAMEDDSRGAGGTLCGVDSTNGWLLIDHTPY